MDITANPPNFALFVGDSEGREEVATNVRDLITQMEYESADGLADMLKFTVMDPPNDQGVYVVSESKLFAPGNEVSVAFGYGADLSHVGRAIIRKIRPVFPAEGSPFMEVVAYTKDMVMADSKPEPLKERKKRGGGVKNSTASARFADTTYAAVVREKAEEYGMVPDVDDTTDAPHDFIQKAGMDDYAFVKGLSNLTGYIFWVDGDEDGNWTLHFKNPDTMGQEGLQEKTFEFTYNNNDFSSVVSFEPEFAIQEAIVKFKATSKNPDTGELFEVTIEEDQGDSPDVRVTIGGASAATAPGAPAGLTPEGQDLEKDFSSASDVKLFLGDFSFDIRANRQFRDAQDLERWAVSWFRRQRENFVLGRLMTIGIESLMARQEHKLTGVGVGFSGLYYFTRVRHAFSGDNAYTCDASVRKIITQKPAAEVISESQGPEEIGS